MYKILRLRQPDNLTSIFVIPKEAARGELTARKLTIPELEKWYGDFSFQVQGIKSWNSLPSQIRFLPSLNSFKTGLIEYLEPLIIHMMIRFFKYVKQELDLSGLKCIDIANY